MKSHWLMLVLFSIFCTFAIDGAYVRKFSLKRMLRNEDLEDVKIVRSAVPSVKNMFLDLFLFKKAKKYPKVTDSPEDSKKETPKKSTQKVVKEVQKAKKTKKQKPIEELSAIEKTKLLNKEKFINQIVQLGTSFGAIYVTQTFFAVSKLNSSDKLVRQARMFFAGYLVFSHVYYYVMKYLIARRHNTLPVATQSQSSVAKMLSTLQTSPLYYPMKMIVGEGVMEIVQSVLPGAASTTEEVLTVEQYDAKKNTHLFHSLLWDIGAVLYMHGFLRLHRFLVLIPVMGLANRLKSPLTLIYVLGLRDDLPTSLLLRPFQSSLQQFWQQTVLSRLRGNITPVVEEDEATPTATPPTPTSISVSSSSTATDTTGEAAKEEEEEKEEEKEEVGTCSSVEDEVAVRVTEKEKNQRGEEEDIDIDTDIETDTVNGNSGNGIGNDNEDSRESTESVQSNNNSNINSISNSNINSNSNNSNSISDSISNIGSNKEKKEKKMEQLQRDFDRVLEQFEHDLLSTAEEHPLSTASTSSQSAEEEDIEVEEEAEEKDSDAVDTEEEEEENAEVEEEEE